MISFAINPPNSQLVTSDGRATAEFYRFLAQLQRGVGSDASPFQSAAFLTLSGNDNLPSQRVLTPKSGELTGADGGAGSSYTIGLADTAVTPGTYGAASKVPVITFDQKGRATGAQAVDVRLPLDVRNYGANVGGGGDDTAAIAAACAAAPFGGEVLLGQGVFNFTNLTVPDGVRLKGSGNYATTLQCTTATGKLTLGVSSEIVDMKVTASVARTLGAELVYIGGNGGVVRDCAFTAYTLAVRAGLVGGAIVVRPTIANCNFFSPVVGVGTGAIALDHYANAIVTDCTGAGAAFPAQQPDFGVRLRNGDTAYLANNNFTLHGRALLMDVPAGLNTYATQIVNCTWDSAGLISGGVYASSAEITPAGNVYDTLIANCWFGLSSNKSGCFVEGQGAGIVNGLTFTGCEFPSNGDSGLLVNGPNVTNWSVVGGWSAANANCGVRVAGASTLFGIVGHRAGPVANRGPNNIGIQVDSATAADNYLIASNITYGNTTANLFDGGTGTNARVMNNAGGSGVQVPASVTVTASPFTYTAGHTEEVLYIRGGTVSNVTQNGVSVFTATGCSVHLAPGESAQITYTVAPTILAKRL